MFRRIKAWFGSWFMQDGEQQYARGYAWAKNEILTGRGYAWTDAMAEGLSGTTYRGAAAALAEHYPGEV